ncbi:9418_t:CDS:2, partial [Gigaspora margarita]
DKLWAIINQAIQNILQQLPEKPENIPKEITNILPFNLLIKSQAKLKAILVALRKIYIFSKLPESYFIELEQLPQDPKDLNTKDMVEKTKFLEEIKAIYSFTLPIPEYIMIVNPTEKPTLLVNIEDIKERVDKNRKQSRRGGREIRSGRDNN